MENYKLSLYVQIYDNRIELLKKCLDSIVKQTNTNFKLIIVNNGAIFETEELIKSFINKYNFFKIEYVKLKKNTKKTLFNIQNVDTEWVTFISDDYLEKEFVETFYKNYLFSKKFIIFSSRTVLSKGQIIETFQLNKIVWNTDEVITNYLNDIHIPSCGISGFFMHTSIIKKMKLRIYPNGLRNDSIIYLTYYLRDGVETLDYKLIYNRLVHSSSYGAISDNIIEKLFYKIKELIAIRMYHKDILKELELNKINLSKTNYTKLKKQCKKSLLFNAIKVKIGKLIK